MGVEKLQEVGIAVRDLAEALRVFTNILGVLPGNTETYDRYGMRFNLCPLGDAYLELIEPTSPEGALAESIERRGEGLHHIAFKVSNLEETMARLREQGIEFVEEAPLYLDVSYGRVKFTCVRPRSFHGVLLELVEVL
jgi:methylmalonyl-CoA/ethylmalonyl-CoA epimerase